MSVLRSERDLAVLVRTRLRRLNLRRFVRKAAWPFNNASLTYNTPGSINHKLASGRAQNHRQELDRVNLLRQIWPCIQKPLELYAHQIVACHDLPSLPVRKPSQCRFLRPMRRSARKDLPELRRAESARSQVLQKLRPNHIRNRASDDACDSSARGPRA
jgi:hypothetical protein